MKQRAWCIRIVCVISMLLIALSMVDRYAGAKTANEINVSVNESINRFYKQVDGAREFMAQAKAVLVMPRLRSRFQSTLQKEIISPCS